MKRILPLLLAMLLFCGCAAAPVAETTAATTQAAQTEPSQAEPAPKQVIGISLPDKKVQRWVDEAAVMEAVLSGLGYGVEILYAGGSAREQARQLQALVDKDVVCLIVAAVDSVELLSAEEAAKKKNIPIVAYDRMLMDTDSVSAFVGFDYQQMGRDMGNYIRVTQKLDEETENGYTMELFMGTPEDQNAYLLYQGLMEVLQSYLDSGALVCNSGRVAFEDCCIADWDADEAAGRCARYLSEDYLEKMPDILCTASDTMAAGCITVLAELEEPPEVLPLITGIGGAPAEGQQFSVQLDTGVLAEPAAMLAHRLITGQELAVTHPEGLHNHAVAVPSWLVQAEQIIQ